VSLNVIRLKVSANDIELKSMSRYSVAEEIANSVTHGIGLLLAIAGLVVLTRIASMHGNIWHVVSCSIYGSTLVLMYMSSTLYHSIPNPSAKKVFRIIDHSTIYLLIAGTYTPFTLVSLRGSWGWSLFGLIWGLALLGILFQVSPLRKMERLRVVLYIAMGWVVMIAAQPLITSVSLGGLLLLLLGGVAYTGGVWFYAHRTLPFAHAIWHGFVLLGSIFHFFAILFYVIP
jgi:hemolysin III